MRCALILVVLAACGDPERTPTRPCDPSEAYPPAVAPEALQYGGPRELALDGRGTRCEQLMRALVAVPELAAFEGAEMTGTCQPDGPTGREIVRMTPVSYGGRPLIKPTPINALRRPDVLAHVSGTMMVYLAGTAWRPGETPDAGCLAEPDVLRTVPDLSLSYLRFNGCVPMGTATYEIAPTDDISTGDAGLFLDADGRLHWGNAIDVYLKRSHVTPDLINSDAYCCSPGELDQCVGARLLIDTHTGELVMQEPHCRTC